MLVKHKELGFTMLELLTVVSISILLMTFAIPAYYDLAKNNYVRSDAELLMSALLTARNTAIDDSRSVSVCPLDLSNADDKYWKSSMSCAVGATAWKSWMVFNGTTTTGIAPADVIQIFNPERTEFKFSPINKDKITFRANGFSEGAATLSAEPENCAITQKQRRLISISISGGINLKRTLCTGT